MALQNMRGSKFNDEVFGVKYAGRHPAALSTVCNCNLSEKSQEMPLFSVHTSRALLSPFLNSVDLFPIIRAHHPRDNANRAGGTRAAGRVCVCVCLCFAYFQLWA